MAQGYEYLTVALAAPLEAGGSSFGTGVPVSDNLVLTARHVVVPDAPANKPVRLRFMASAQDGFGPTAGAKGNGFRDALCDAAGSPDEARGVIWSSSDLDLALVRAARAPDIEVAQLHPALPNPFMDWLGAALPDAARENGDYTVRRIRGTANTPNPHTPFFQVDATVGLSFDQHKDNGDDDAEGWSGASGSGLFVDNRLIGILTDRLPNAGAHHLRAVSLQAALDEDHEFRRWLGLDEHKKARLVDLAGTLAALQPVLKMALAQNLVLPAESSDMDLAKGLSALALSDGIGALERLTSGVDTVVLEDIALCLVALSGNTPHPQRLRRAVFSTEVDYDLASVGNETAAEFLMATAEDRRPRFAPLQDNSASAWPRGTHALPELPEIGSEDPAMTVSNDLVMRTGADLLALDEHFETELGTLVPGTMDTLKKQEMRRRLQARALQKQRQRNPDAASYYFAQPDPGPDRTTERAAMEKRLVALREAYPGIAAVFLTESRGEADFERYYDLKLFLEKDADT